MTKNDEIKKILAEQYNIEIEQLDVFPGTNPDATPEEIALEIVKSIDEIVRGDAEMVDVNDYYKFNDNVYVEDGIEAK